MSLIVRASVFGFIAAALAAPALAQEAPVPKEYIGQWAKGGACNTPGARLVITETTAQLGTGSPAAIVYYPDDAGEGKGAVHWQEEGNVDNFVYQKNRDAILYNPEGYNMPGAQIFKRCTKR